MAKTCAVEYVSDNPDQPDLSCDKTNRPHVVHRDPATKVKYTRAPGGMFCLCGVRKHRKGCPLG